MITKDQITMHKKLSTKPLRRWSTRPLGLVTLSLLLGATFFLTGCPGDGGYGYGTAYPTAYYSGYGYAPSYYGGYGYGGGYYSGGFLLGGTAHRHHYGRHHFVGHRGYGHRGYGRRGYGHH